MNRIKSIPNSYSAFSVYIKFKPETQPYVNHPRYFQECYGSVWKLSEFNEETFPQGFMYITPPTINQGFWANRMIVNCLMSFEPFRKWEHTSVGHRGIDYEQWKDKLKNKVLDKLEKIHPGFKSSIDTSFASTPLTIRDYFGVKEGSLYGQVKNLLLTGQNVNLHGICGVPLTAIETAEAIVGHGVILDKINNCK